jgi:hypothetical protein
VHSDRTPAEPSLPSLDTGVRRETMV